MVGSDLDAGNKPPVEEKKEFIKKAFWLGRDLLS